MKHFKNAVRVPTGGKRKFARDFATMLRALARQTKIRTGFCKNAARARGAAANENFYEFFSTMLRAQHVPTFQRPALQNVTVVPTHLPYSRKCTYSNVLT